MVQLKSHPALVIVDMQNGFCHEKGTFGKWHHHVLCVKSARESYLNAGKMGLPVERMSAVIPTINRLRVACHQKNIPVYFTRSGWNSDYSDSGILFEEPPASAVKELGGFVRGTWDASIVDELTPDLTNSNEEVLDKTRNSAFCGTNFSEKLAKRRINQLIVTGVGTNVCVECTARDAFQNDIYTVTVSDATGTISDSAHNATMESLQWFGGTATTPEVESALEARLSGN